VGRRHGPAAGWGCPSANYRALSVSPVSTERAAGIAFLLRSYLELKIAGDLMRDQGLILAYTRLPVLSSEQAARELVELSSRREDSWRSRGRRR
jgi:hypothetical protein